MLFTATNCVKCRLISQLIVYIDVIFFFLLFFYLCLCFFFFFFFSSRRRHTRSTRDWSSDVCSSDLLCRFIFRVKQRLLFRDLGLDLIKLCVEGTHHNEVLLLEAAKFGLERCQLELTLHEHRFQRREFRPLSAEFHLFGGRFFEED